MTQIKNMLNLKPCSDCKGTGKFGKNRRKCRTCQGLGWRERVNV